MAAFINDGTLPYGSQVLTIDTVAYVAENINITRPGTILERKSEIGDPSGQVGIAGFVTGSATLQLAAAATAHPDLGDTFTATFGEGSETWFVSSVSPAYEAEGITKINIEFRKKIN